MFMIPAIDKPNQARFLYDLVARTCNTILEPPDIPDQSRIIETIARCPSWSNIDFSYEYHNIRIHPAYEKHTVFVTPYGTYRTGVMQRVDCYATATFQKMMNNPFRDEIGIFVCVYIDNIFIFSRTYIQHLTDVRTVPQRHKDHKFYAFDDKSQFPADVWSVLVHIITKRGISPQPWRVTKIQHWPYPEKRQELQSFLRMVNYMHQFPPNLAIMRSSLTELAAGTATCDWNTLHSKCFQEVKNAVTADAAVRHLIDNSTETMYLMTGASLIGIDASVGQVPNRVKIRQGLFHSGKLNPAKKSYSTYDKELCPIVDVS